MSKSAHETGVAAATEKTFGCTVGVINEPGCFLLFKNRDLSAEYALNGNITFHSTPDRFSLKGYNLENTGAEGVSIGVNRSGVCVANTHVASNRDVTYDVLCEAILSNVKKQDDLLLVVKDFISGHALQGGRIIVAAPGWGILLEVFEKDFQMEPVKNRTVITNHFSLLHPIPPRNPDDRKSSLQRLETASGAIDGIKNLGGVKSLLRSHVPEKGLCSICVHSERVLTESSHIISIDGECIRWHWLRGNPCENDYSTKDLFKKA